MLYYPDTKALGDFVEWQLRDEPVDEISDYTFPEITGKRVAQHDDRYEYVRFYFQIEETESYSETLYLYGRLSFRRDVSSFGDADWDRFIDRIAGSLEFKD